jgi:hypothetical protein
MTSILVSKPHIAFSKPLTSFVIAVSKALHQLKEKGNSLWLVLTRNEII